MASHLHRRQIGGHSRHLVFGVGDLRAPAKRVDGRAVREVADDRGRSFEMRKKRVEKNSKTRETTTSHSWLERFYI
jgi:hypothetical protein